MKKNLKVFVAGLLSLSLLAGCTGDKSAKTVVSVNDTKVTYGEYLKQFAFQKYMIESMYGAEIFNQTIPAEQTADKKEITMLDQFKNGLVDDLAERNLLAQEAKKANVAIDEKELKTSIDGWKASFAENTIAKKYYEDNGITEEFMTNSLRQQLELTAFEKQYSDKNAVTEKEVDEYYTAHKAEYSNEQVQASHIIIKTQNDDGTEMSADKVAEAKKKIDEVYSKVKAGEDFSTLAKQYSQDGTKDSGGDLGLFGKGQMVKEFEDVVFNMKVGDVSEPFKTQFGYHIVKLTDKKADTSDPKQIKEYVKGLLQQEKFNKYVEELVKSAKITKHMDVIKNAQKDIIPAEVKKDDTTSNNNDAKTTENKDANSTKTEDKK